MRKESRRASRPGDRQTEKGGQTDSRESGNPQLCHGSFLALDWLSRRAVTMTRLATTRARRSSSRFALAKTGGPDDSCLTFMAARRRVEGKALVHGV
jgi:hypothetical protein